jgi:hypothetical protein
MQFFTDTFGLRKRKNRPYGKLPEKRDLEEMLSSAHAYVDGLSGFSEVVGITLGGGLSRGYGDRLSEIDLNIYLDGEGFKTWRRGGGPIPQGDHLGEKYHMDVEFLSREAERQASWSLLKKWDASYAQILYDPTGEIEELLGEKDVFTAEEKRGIAFKNHLDCIYFGEIVVRQWILRNDPLAASHLINRGISALANLLFLVNDEYPPFEKWLVNFSYSLQWRPEGWEELLGELILVKAIGLQDVQRRSRLLLDLYHQIWGKLVGEGYGSTGLLELEALEALQYVVDTEPTLKMDGDLVIRFNRAKYLEEKRNGFPSFLGWNRKILNQLKVITV